MEYEEIKDAEMLAEHVRDSSLPQYAVAQELDPFAEAMLSRLRKRVFQVDCPVTKIGRFSVDKPLGQGGMGVVYSAIDEQLGRTIALKVVRGEDGHSSSLHQRRLLREAQAMARLSHPNVVQVYEAGTHDGRVYIAMELVRGETLASWLRSQAREWDAIIEVFCQAGRGLAAAHAFGIIHRDFKPENVLIGEDGRVRVTDFGIARVLSESDDCNATDPDETAAPQQPLTATGARPGTPFYMSPEQFNRGSVTAKSDQFSFCVALFDALFAVRPFAGETYTELAFAVSQGVLRDVRLGRVPRRVHRAIVRGLSVDPAHRFPAMEHLLSALLRRSRLRVIVPVVFAIAGTIALYPVFDRLVNPPCDAQVQLANVWGQPLQDELARVFTTEDPLDGETLWTSTRSQLSHYTQQWEHAYVESCRARRTGEISAQLHALRKRCLDRRLGVFAQLTSELREGEPSVLLKAPRAASKLDEVERCADHDTLLLGMDPPRAAVADTIDRLRDELSSARADELVGLLDRSGAKAQATLNRALAVGYRPTIAEAHLQLGRVATLARDYQAAREALISAGLLAVETGNDEVALESRMWLVVATAVAESAPEEAEIWLAEAEAWMTRYSGSPRQRAWLQTLRGLIYSMAGKFELAQREQRAAIKQYESFPRPIDFELLVVREQLANTLVRTREPQAMAEALALYRTVLQQRELHLGASHPDQITVRFNLGVTLGELGSEYFDEAEQLLVEARELAETRFGAEHLEVGNYHLGLAGLLFNRQKFERAAHHTKRAIKIYDEHLSPTHPDRAYALNYEGEILSKQGEHSEALARFREAHRIWSRELPGSELVGVAEAGIGQELVALQRYSEAHEVLTRAVNALEQTVGPTSPYLATPLAHLAEVALELGGPCEARAYLGRVEGLSGVIDPMTEHALSQIKTRIKNMDVVCMEKREDDALVAIEKEEVQ